MKNDFDWFIGTWTSVQKRLVNGVWEDWKGISRVWSVLDGAGNVDELSFPDQGFRGVTLRLYDKATDLWSLYWASGTAGLALPPNVGRFDESGTGVFLCEEVIDEVPMVVRYLWSDITETTAHWEQAFSADKGETWDTNWLADFVRVD